jgi:hypothetical protein
MEANKHIILCSGIKLPSKLRKTPSSHLLKLDLDENSKHQNIKIGLPHFTQKVNCHFPDRIKDLLEIAGYVYAADRLIKRGTPDQLEYHNWSRHQSFHIKVRDFDFWNDSKVKAALNELLVFVSGDLRYDFTFSKGATDVGQKSLFDFEGIEFEEKDNSVIALFSGGLDSLAGALEILENTEHKLCIVSHRSNNFTVKAIQNDVYNLLKRDYEKRVMLFPFECNLTGDRAVEETQRTRVFLYTSIAFSLSIHTLEPQINVFENGVTSMNIAKRQDLMNARASRTTHPKTLYLLEQFFNLVAEKKVTVNDPFVYKTKTDILEIIKGYNKQIYINSTLSCTKTFIRFKNNSKATHCGGCSQCVDRRIAAFASELEDFDATYDVDLAKDPIKDLEAKAHLNSFLKFNIEMNDATGLSFCSEYLDAISDLIDFIPGETHSAKANEIFNLLKKNSGNVIKALKRIRDTENILGKKKKDTLFTIIDDRTYLKLPAELFIEKICGRLSVIIPQTFSSSKPTHENGLNDAINAHILNEAEDYEREFPTVRFSFGTAVPDHSFESYDLFIEAKYVRKTTAKSRITDEIAADITKYPENKMKLFVIYDPEGRIDNSIKFIRDFEKKPSVKIYIVK